MKVDRVELRPEPPATAVALMVTRRCNMECGHCNVESSPHVATEPTEAQLLDYVRQAAAARVRAVNLTGGEPMLRYPVVLRLVRECRRLGLGATIVTNGFWGRVPDRARRRLRALHRAGLSALTVSYDRYHAAFQGYEPVLHLAQAAEAIGLPMSVTLVRTAEDAELDEITARLEDFRGVRLRIYDVQPVGRARLLESASLRDQATGLCVSCTTPTVTDDGRLLACGGSAYFAGPASPLVVGLLRDSPLDTLLAKHRTDPVLDTIRTFGPGRLRDELRRIPGFEGFPFRARYFGICDLCHHVTSSPAAVTALRRRLAEPAVAAPRMAAWQVLNVSRRAGALNPANVNGAGAARIFLRAAWDMDARWAPGSEKLLGRVDLDWRRWTAYLIRCGLARPLLPALAEPALQRWAPTFFAESLRAAATTDGLAELVQREAIRRIGEVLVEMGVRAVLLKGAALREIGAGDRPPRAAGDIDLLVDPAAAPGLRSRLLGREFRGDADSAAGGHHHLPPVAFQGSLVEIHTRILADFWGLPEAEMRAHARPLPGVGPFSTLDAAGLLLHAGVHTAQHCFSHGLKAAWDLLAVLESTPGVDWDRLVRWVRASRVPRGFWAPVRVLTREMGLPIPAEILRQAPDDGRQRRLEAVAARRLFSVAEAAVELNPFSRHGLIALLHDGWLERARYLVTRPASRPARPAGQDGPSRRAWPRVALGQAWLHWRGYRRLTRRPTVPAG